MIDLAALNLKAHTDRREKLTADIDECVVKDKMEVTPPIISHP